MIQTLRERADLVRRADANYPGLPDFDLWARTPLDDDIWRSALDAFEAQKRKASKDTLRQALDFALRAAAVDTGALEDLYDVDRGFTFSVALQFANWENDIAAKGPHVRPLFEAQRAGLELVIDAATKSSQLSEAWVRRLHEVLCREQATYRVVTSEGMQEQPLPKGEYKRHPNHVLLPDGSVHSYCPVDRVSSEMHRLLTYIRTPEFDGAHPIIQASYVHYALTVVHPFADGNGRVARAFASMFTYRAASIPLVVFFDQKPRYLDALHQADAGRFGPFVQFVLHAVVDSLESLSLRLRSARSSSVHESLGALERLYVSCGDLTHQELDAIAARVASALRDEFGRQLEQAGMPVQVQHELKLERSSIAARDKGFRRVVGNVASVITIALQSAPPAAAQTGARFHVVVAREPGAQYVVRVEQVDGGEALQVRLDQVHPVESAVFRSLLESWVEIRLSEQTSALQARAAQALRSSGY